MIHSFCLETNRYANQNGVAGFQDVGLEEIMAFVMDIATGIVNTVLLHARPSVMNRDRFLQILYSLHLNNNQNDPGNDKLFGSRASAQSQCKTMEETLKA